jgi:hypothetical protein
MHHISRLKDLRATLRVSEVEYSDRHPLGEACSNTAVISFEAQRRAAATELASRGNPEYDLSAYKSEGCWDIPVSNL